MADDQVVDMDIDDGNDDDFDAGFSNAEATAKQSTETPINVEKTVDKPVVEKQTLATEPKYAKVTEEQLSNLLASAASVNEIKTEYQKKFDSVFGTVGNLKQLLGQLQAGTQAGKQVELTPEDVKEISAMYPELGVSMLKDLQKIAGKLRGTSAEAPAFDESKVDQRVMHHLAPNGESISDRIKNEIAAEDLAETFPNWREITGPKDSNSEFRQWLKKQEDGYEAKVLNSSRAKVISDALTKFMESKKPAAPAPAKANKRADRLAEAVAPKGAGGHGSISQEEDEFDVGFKNARSR